MGVERGPKIAESYVCRTGRFVPESRYRLFAEGLEWRRGARHGRIAYRDIPLMQIYKERFLGSAKTYWAATILCRGGARLRLGAASRVGAGAIEDRTELYIPFVKELERRIHAANPDAIFRAAQHRLARLEAFVARLALKFLPIVRRLGPECAGDLFAAVLRRIGPALRGQVTARANLAGAFPDKRAGEIERILDGMWANLGRSLSEYAFLDRLWDFDLNHPRLGRIVVDDIVCDRLRRLQVEDRPALFFAAHLANWELPAVPPRKIGRRSAMLYRPLRIAPLAEALTRARQACMGELIAADAFTVLRIKEAFENGALIGIVADQHFALGVDVVFFGRRCKVNSMLARLARTFDCPVYGARMIRLPAGRLRYELTEALALPRDASGRIDVAGSMQRITTVIEGWVREHPEQWMWLHRRWR